MALLQNPLLHGTSKARYYTAPLQSLLLYDTLKPVVTWHPKARCYTALLQSSLLYGTFKAHCNTAPLQSLLLHDTLTKPVAT